MHDIEPYFKWRDRYIASRDRKTPFFGRVNSEFSFSNKIYNYYIHPQWDDFGSQTLYTKLLFVDYKEEFAVLEMIGEWNDCLHNDIMFLKREVADVLMQNGIHKFVLICENVLNFHAGEDDYYQEWQSEVADEGGWIMFLNTLDHVVEEMQTANIQFYIHFGQHYNNVNWRLSKPKQLLLLAEKLLDKGTKQLRY